MWLPICVSSKNVLCHHNSIPLFPLLRGIFQKKCPVVRSMKKIRHNNQTSRSK
ncbi:hypothetical protein BACPEC_02103 [[Bacteroides] pectinophilus ATCC 43243]|uniref:Uncharacterized protein n=1 Tax=[Bacteroides] pectinophilus ATCC 43243 TaxID=483218 RepID=B7ASP8_9FIRM|nr:hypothetical protein BACPEC_02103 [[Bacteroides] pectinophilus ATCC 43243]